MGNWLPTHATPALLAGRLPRHLADEVVEAVLQLFSNQVALLRVLLRMHVCRVLFVSGWSVHFSRVVCTCSQRVLAMCACAHVHVHSAPMYVMQHKVLVFVFAYSNMP